MKHSKRITGWNLDVVCGEKYDRFELYGSKTSQKRLDKFKKSILKRLNLWEVKTGRSSPVCEKPGLPLKHALASRQCLFQGRACSFQQDEAKARTASMTTTSWLLDKSPGPELVCLQSRPIWCVHQTVGQLESYIRPEWDNMCSFFLISSSGVTLVHLTPSSVQQPPCPL